MSDTPLTGEQIRKLYAACGDDVTGHRNRVLVALLLNCALSAAEASSLRFNHVDLHRRWLWVVEGFRRPRFVPLNDKASGILAEWRRHPEAPRTYVFGRVPNSLRRRSERSIRNDMSQISEAAEVPFSSEKSRITLAKFLFDYSDDGQLIRDVIPEDKKATATLPLENLPPFSVAYHPTEIFVASKGMIPGPWEFGQPPQETAAIEYGRKMLERVAQYL